MSNIEFIKLKKNLIQEEKYGDENKYGDDEMFEPWADVNIFLPIATKLVDPLHDIGMTPNMVTITSTIFTFISIYFLHQDKRIHAFLAYIFGYILDCVDGRMARKYSMSSELGMALDCVSDNLSNAVLFGYIFLNRQYNKKTIGSLGILVLLSYMLSLSFGLNEAISSFESTGNDNFYEKRLNQLKDKGNCLEKHLYSVFLSITKISYETYRYHFPVYDRNKINKKLKTLKHFGPGNYCLFVGIMMLYI
jgi:hypothetical protein